jgi:hypothetical protein
MVLELLNRERPPGHEGDRFGQEGIPVPRQNRVTPFGALIVTPCRGTLMGNRGRLHDERQRVRRPFLGKRWIVCVLEFRGRHREVMAPGRYTELFFLDEATALAAGHRPCAECQRGRYRLFREHWAAANPDAARSPAPPAARMDAVLHVERLDSKKRKRTYAERLSRLPSGVLVTDEEGHAYLVRNGTLLLWTSGSYRATEWRPAGTECRVLTPPSVVAAIAHGYPVGWHVSAEASNDGRGAC